MSIVFTARESDGSIVFQHRRYVVSFFLCYHDNSWTAALSLMKFCMNMYLHNFWKPIEYQSHRPEVKVTWFFVRFCLDDTRWQYLALSEGFTSLYRCFIVGVRNLDFTLVLFMQFVAINIVLHCVFVLLPPWRNKVFNNCGSKWPPVCWCAVRKLFAHSISVLPRFFAWFRAESL